MRTRTKLCGATIAIAAGAAAWSIGASRAAADEARLTVTPAVLRSTDTDHSNSTVQLVRWGPYGYGYRGYYRPYARPYYYGGGYYAPYYGGGYYATPVYGYGYPYPAYGYGPPIYGGIGIRTGRVGVGVW